MIKMNPIKCNELIKYLNKYDIIDIGLWNIYDENNFYDDPMELINHMNNHRIPIKENNNEYIYEFIVYKDKNEINNIDEYLKENLINELDNIGLSSYSIIDYDEYENQHEFIIEIWNIHDDEFDEIINNIIK